MSDTDIDLSFFLEPPELDTHATLTIEALAPLSMSSAHPGTYYRSQPAPTEAMLYGMLENALGWHFPEDVRSDLLKKLRKEAKSELGRGHPLKEAPWITGDEDAESGSGFVSLMQHHLKFETAMLPETTHFDDLWTRHLFRGSDSFRGGSQNNDYRVEALVNSVSSKRVLLDRKEKSDIQSPKEALDPTNSDKVAIRLASKLLWAFNFGFELPGAVTAYEGALRPFYPTYYRSPKPREYVIPARPYRYRVKTTSTVCSLIESALGDPQAPLYLGTNDGWVEASWEVIQ